MKKNFLVYWELSKKGCAEIQAESKEEAEVLFYDMWNQDDFYSDTHADACTLDVFTEED